MTRRRRGLRKEAVFGVLVVSHKASCSERVLVINSRQRERISACVVGKVSGKVRCVGCGDVSAR
jgi:hypothetical protein